MDTGGLVLGVMFHTIHSFFSFPLQLKDIKRALSRLLRAHEIYDRLITSKNQRGLYPAIRTCEVKKVFMIWHKGQFYETPRVISSRQNSFILPARVADQCALDFLHLANFYYPNKLVGLYFAVTDDEMGGWLIAVIVLAPLTVIFLFVTFCLYRYKSFLEIIFLYLPMPCFSHSFIVSFYNSNNFRRKMYEKDLLNDAWIIDFNQIIFGSVDNRFASKVRMYKPVEMM